jgi:hypothetical protein
MCPWAAYWNCYNFLITALSNLILFQCMSAECRKRFPKCFLCRAAQIAAGMEYLESMHVIHRYNVVSFVVVATRVRTSHYSQGPCMSKRSREERRQSICNQNYGFWAVTWSGASLRVNKL